MTVTKTVMGSCFFEYITEHDSVEKALNNEGIFKEVKVNKVQYPTIRIRAFLKETRATWEMIYNRFGIKYYFES